MMFNKLINGEIAWPKYEGKDIVAIREACNLTQDALAALLGVTRETIDQWEKDIEVLPVPAAIALCTFSKLGAGIYDLMESQTGHFEIKPAEEISTNLTADSESSTYNLTLYKQKITLPEPFDGQAVFIIRKRLGLTRREFARLLGVSTSIVDKWELGTVELQGTALMVFKILWMQGEAVLPEPIESCLITGSRRISA